MFGCRKIYGNLLLLSVMFLSLGASVRPRVAAIDFSERSWQNPVRNIEFQWDNRSGAIVYRGSGLTALGSSEFDWLLPESCTELFFHAATAEKHIECLSGMVIGDCRLPVSRAPPAEKSADK